MYVFAFRITALTICFMLFSCGIATAGTAQGREDRPISPCWTPTKTIGGDDGFDFQEYICHIKDHSCTRKCWIQCLFCTEAFACATDRVVVTLCVRRRYQGTPICNESEYAADVPGADCNTLGQAHGCPDICAQTNCNPAVVIDRCAILCGNGE